MASDTLQTIGAMILARKGIITDLNKKLKNHEDVVRWRKEKENHRDAIRAQLLEAHRRIVIEQELGPDMWTPWLKVNCKYSRAQAYRLMKLREGPDEEEDEAEDEGEVQQLKGISHELGFPLPRGPNRLFALAKRCVEKMGSEEMRLFDAWYKEKAAADIGPILVEKEDPVYNKPGSPEYQEERVNFYADRRQGINHNE